MAQTVKMQDGEVPASEDLSLLVRAVRAHLLWQVECGAFGLPTEQIRAQLPEPAPIAEQLASEAPSAAPRSPDRENSSKLSQILENPRIAPPAMAPIANIEVPKTAEERRLRLGEIAAQCASCTKCGLHTERKQAVFSRGNPETEIMIVGEGPGADEDAQGEPFVGAAGQLLDKMIVAMGYGRDDFYIANVVKCRPPKNRNPEAAEMAACLPYLHEQIALVNPKVIICMGATALKGLLGVEGITQARGKWRLYRASIPVMPTFHPAYLLRQTGSAAKKDVWEDLKLVLKQVGRSLPEKKR